jgi:death-on-curing protein
MDGETYIDRLDIYDFLVIGEAVLGIQAEALQRSSRLDLAESALAAPFAGFGDYVAYPDPVDRAAICCSRIARNHPLIDGNKRVGYECMREMLDRSAITWPRPSEDAVSIALTVEGLAARTITEEEFRAWARQRVGTYIPRKD